MKASDKIIIRENVYNKFMHFVDKAPGEVSGLGSVEVIDGVPVVTDVWICKQKNTGASTELDADDAAKLMYEHRDKDLRWWVHSHANMSVFWSKTDDDTIKELGEHGWICATVFNKKREMKSAIYTKAERKTAINNFIPETYSIFLENVQTVILQNIPMETVAGWDAEYESAVERPFRQPWQVNQTSTEWKMWMEDKCCKTYPIFEQTHWNEIKAALERPTTPVEATVSEVTGENIGDFAALQILEERRANDELVPTTGEILTYEEVREEVEFNYKSSIPKEKCLIIIEQLFGPEWTGVVGNTYDRLDYKKDTEEYLGLYGDLGCEV